MLLSYNLLQRMYDSFVFILALKYNAIMRKEIVSTLKILQDIFVKDSLPLKKQFASMSFNCITLKIRIKYNDLSLYVLFCIFI